jgi:hypothetical protein
MGPKVAAACEFANNTGYTDPLHFDLDQGAAL